MFNCDKRMSRGAFTRVETLKLDTIWANIKSNTLGKNLVGFAMNIICQKLVIYTPAIASSFSLNYIRDEYFHAFLIWDYNANFNNFIHVNDIICCDIMTRELQLSSG